VDEASDRLQRCTLPDAVAAQQPNHFAVANLERDPVEDVALAVITVDVLDLKQRATRHGFHAPNSNAVTAAQVL
jgi:hypothetical protein